MKAANPFPERVPGRAIRAFNIALAALILALMGACSPRPEWSPDEIDNGRHFLQSLEANQKAAQLARKGDPDVPQFGIEDINRYQAAALREARLVQDAVLDKAHPELKQHFRLEYQKGLETILASYNVGTPEEPGGPSHGQVDRQAAGLRLLGQWTAWFNAHHNEIRMPGQAVAKSK